MATNTRLVRPELAVDRNEIAALADAASKIALIVVDQSPPAGTMLPRGTTVTLTVVPAYSVPVKVFDGAPASIREKNVADFAGDIRKQPAGVVKVLEDGPEFAALGADDRAAVTAALVANVPGLDAGSAGAVEAAFNAARGALTLTGGGFGG